MSHSFDRDYALAELLPAPLLETIGAPLSSLLGSNLAIVDAEGRLLWGRELEGSTRQALVIELEPIGFIAAVVDADRLRAAAGLLQQILLARMRYLMAGSLHTESTQANYEALLAKHEALVESEARYRALAEDLERQVAAQVSLLDQRQRQLYQAEKLASVGQLAAGVAHEINNPIGFVRSNITTLGGYIAKLGELKARLGEVPSAWSELDLDFVSEDGVELVNDCISGIDRVARIVRDLKGFSNIERADAEMVDLNGNLREVMTVLAGQMPPGVDTRLELEPLPKVICLPGHLNQVFLGVIHNALLAVQDSGHPGEVVVATRPVEEGVEIIVSDNGVGMSTEQIQRMFDPFYTTREVGSGTGLGLTVARDVVEAHHGRISVDSRIGTGTTVTIFLPL
ncbi:sensor histidine kinase [Denitratisoma oestradiolicum]|uniref:histidine kinase n=1 Tax=Denitratisoma oestradiolicum TaxID=311182 RepID=A0A6S6XYA4_9PROT|nr:ATP-binding protein [Denitratisoma oestradiolicum]TWO80247.1 hypothetical protein CBW56_10565 [Denitratisoma oestradiolicum]CAB1369337.1 conserved protein of unknown function [Denitratisoma oestradiolicum]